MKKYEVGFIVSAQIDEAKTKEVIEKLKAIYTDAGKTILEELDLGIRELAYTIDKVHKSGYYYFMIVQADHETNKEFERISRLDSNVIRFMTIDVSFVEGSTLDVLREK